MEAIHLMYIWNVDEEICTNSSLGPETAEVFLGHWVIFCSVEKDVVDGFPNELPEEYKNMSLLKGRATMDMRVKVKDNPNPDECVFRLVLDGYDPKWYMLEEIICQTPFLNRICL
ncbi:peptidyl-prolyl cis-trans isomerase CYP38 [Striga asiatica]|uniref:peptidylprolyl isomerase n=1 Tax=Striga asiatica TaxID=4170 RepID=A0A5A7Q4P3_STRAF|nr:peptidyl-prolyl cis-trans isomerase CYP38 [Striga asiatica]